MNFIMKYKTEDVFHPLFNFFSYFSGKSLKDLNSYPSFLS